MKPFRSIITTLVFLFCFASVAQAQEETSMNVPDNDTTIYTIVDKMPSFPGGDAFMYMFLAKNVRYPQRPREDGYYGKVYVKFVVETDGSLSNIEVLKGVGGGCTEEALRVIDLMPKWVPGETADGKKARVNYTLPVDFRLH